jgi:hypothetical protein
MLAQAERQMKADCKNKLGPLQDQITEPNNGPEVVLNNLGKHAMWSNQVTNPNRSGTLFSLRDSMKEITEIIQRWGQDYLIIWTGRKLEYWHSDELTDDLGINNDNMFVHRRLKGCTMIINLKNLEVYIELSDKPGVHNTCTVAQIPPVVGLDSVVDTVQRSHHDV